MFPLGQVEIVVEMVPPFVPHEVPRPAPSTLTIEEIE